MRKITIASILLLFASSLAVAETHTVIDRPSQGVAVNHVIDVGDYDRFSLQGVYADGTPSGHTIVDGVKQAATITVADPTTGLNGTAASATINVSSVTGVSGDVVVVWGYRYEEGEEWSVGATTTTSATALAAAVNRHPSISATSSGSTVTVTAVALGTVGNTYTLTTTDATWLIISGANFTGGIDAPSIRVNSVTFTEGTDFDVVASSDTTADNIADAINADITVGAQVVASTVSNVITLTSILSGQTSYGVSSSTTGFTTTVFSAGAPTDINIDNDQISEAAHSLTTGLQVLFQKSAGTDPTGLTSGTTYWSIRVSKDYYQLASSSNNAIAGTDIDITDVTGGGTFSVTPLSLTAGSAGYKWQGSNDNTNWSDLTSLSSITYSVLGAGNTLWDVGEYDYRYIRMNYTAPTQGGLDLDVILNGRK